MYEYILLSKLNNNIVLDIFLLIFIIPIFKIVTTYLEYNFEGYINNFRRKNYNTIIFTGWNTLKNGIFYFDYPIPMNAICQYVVKNNLSNKLKFYSIERNSVFYIDYIDKNDNSINYILDEKENITISKDISLDIVTHKVGCAKEKDDNSNITTWKIELVLKSKTNSISNLTKFVENIMSEYQKSKEKQILYHFIYQGWDEEMNCPKFSKSILSNLENDDEKSFETFDTLFSEHKSRIIKSIDRLKDMNYYKRTGLKRKVGYLFYGPPGCGKTSHVIAMSNYSKSHIIEVPLSRVNNNREIEGIINISKINDMDIPKDKLIILFDEIDQIDKVLNKDDKILNMMCNNKNTNNVPSVNIKNNDTLSMGYILSRLDGVGNYNGIKIVATTNHKDKLEPALYRDGRLTPLYFDLIGRDIIKDIIEHYYQIKIDIETIPEKIKIAPSTLKKHLEDYQYNSEGLIKFINSI
jgi:hypothetical protein